MQIRNNPIKFNLIDLNDWMINHLGKNPKNGGSPPSDNKDLINKNFKVGL